MSADAGRERTQAGADEWDGPVELEQLVRECHGFVYRLALRILGDIPSAEDAVQETFLRAWRHLGKLRRRGRLKTWLYRIAYNVCLDETRRRRRAPMPADSAPNGALLETADPRGSAEVQALAAHADSTLLEALGQLPPSFRAVLVLREVEALSYAQIARILRCPVGTVRSRLARARRALRLALESHEEGGG